METVCTTARLFGMLKGMPRQPIILNLPSLTEQFRHFHGFGPREPHGDHLTELLRDTIEAVRQPQELPFYPVAGVARHFGVSTKTVSQCYRKLATEGLLRVLRGSKTLIRGRRLQPRQPVLGVVGIPVYLPGFIIGSELRSFHIRLEQALRRYRYVADFIFFQHDEQSSPDLAERLIEHQLDVLLWINPGTMNRSTIQTVLDGGIAVVLCVDGRASMPRRQYVYNSNKALAEAVATWRREGLRSVAVWHNDPRDEPTAQFPVLVRVLNKAAFPFTVHRLTAGQAILAAEEVLADPEKGLILPAHHWYESLANQYPALMQRLFSANRVLLMQGPLYHPAYQGGSLRADVISMPYDAMADRIARDIGEGRFETTEPLATFHARFEPRLELGTVSRKI